jgi:hypothetical protein
MNNAIAPPDAADSMRLLHDPALMKLAGEYRKRQIEIEKQGSKFLRLNPFALVSEVYHHENFHSDIFSVLLNPLPDSSDEVNVLHRFISFLKTKHGVCINPDEYTSPDITREEGRIDVLIKDRKSMKALIIENKINGAVDMSRQVVRYLDDVTEQGFSCDTIIYLRMRGHGYPDTSDWKPGEFERVKPLLKVIRAFDDKETDLLNGWLIPCELAAQDHDVRYLFKHYITLLQQLGPNAMSRDIISKFYSEMLHPITFQGFQSLKKMADSLVGYRKENIVEKFKNKSHPFRNVSLYDKEQESYVIFNDLVLKASRLQISIYANNESYTFWFGDDLKYCVDKQAGKLLAAMGADFPAVDDCYTKQFNFPEQEESLFQHIETFLRELEKAIAAGGLR